jgi:hypothetical protein
VNHRKRRAACSRADGDHSSDSSGLGR